MRLLAPLFAFLAAPPAGTPTLSWNAVSGAGGYRAKWGTATGVYGSNQAVAGTSVTLATLGIPTNDDVIYYVTVCATAAGEDSTNNAAELVIRNGALYAAPPGQVTGLSATATGPTTISLGWTATASATSYKVERSPNGTDSWTQIGTPSTNTYGDSGLTAETQYFYRVRATNAAGDGTYSSTANATTTAAGGGGVDVWAASGTAAAINAAIASASAGQVVGIPVDSQTISTNITISKAITLRGSGGGRIIGASASSVAIGTGTKTFAGIMTADWQAGDAIIAIVPNAAGNTMTGTVTSNSGGTLTLNITSVTGSGTRNMWVFRKPPQTTLTLNAGAQIVVTEQAGGVVGVEDIEIKRGTSSADLFSITGGGRPIRVRFCHIENPSGDVFDTALTTHSYVGRNSFVSEWSSPGNSIRTASCLRYKNTGDDGSWTTANTVGANAAVNGEDKHYCEHNVFLWFSTETLDMDDNSRCVIRNNLFHHSGITSHGQDTSQDGVRHYEIYDNRWLYDNNQTEALLPNMDYLIYLRGGSGIIADNVVDDINNTQWGNKTEIKMTIQSLQRNAGANACYAGAYPCPRQIGQGHNGTTLITEGLYIYNNTGGGTINKEDYFPNQCGGGAQSVSTFLLENRDYFFRAPQSGETYFGWTKFGTHPQG